MAICKNCGSAIEDGVKFCPECGTAADTVQSEQPVKTAEPVSEASNNKENDLTEKLKELNNTPDSTAEFDPEDITANKTMAILSYLSILVLIPFFKGKESKYVLYHLKQGINLFAIELLIWILDGIIRGFGLIFGLANFLTLILAVIGIINVVNCKAKELPIIGKLAIGDIFLK